MSQEDIIDPLALAAGYICLIYKSPFKATGLKQRFMRDDIKYQKVFSPETNLNVWYPIVRLLKKTDQALLELKSNVKAVRFQKNYRQIILFATISRLMGTFLSNHSLFHSCRNFFSVSNVSKLKWHIIFLFTPPCHF